MERERQRQAQRQREKQAQRQRERKKQGKEKSKRKGKEKGKSKEKSKEGTSDTSNTKCSFCKGKDCPKSLTWPADKKTMSHELCKLTMIDSDASVHTDSQWWNVLCGSRTFKTVVEKEKRAGTQFDVTSRVQAGFGVPGPAARDTLDGDEPSVHIRIRTGPVIPSAEEKPCATSGHAPYRRWCRWCAAARAADEPHLSEQQPETDEAVSRIESDPAELEREEDQTLSTSSLNAPDDGSESLTPTLCSTKALSDHLTETTLAFVEVLGHNVVMLRLDQDPVLVQLLKTVQSRRHQSQSKNENVNQVINGVCWSMWLSLENLLREKLSNDSILLAWLIRHAAWSLTKFQVKNDRRTALLLRVSGKACTSQLPFGERMMYEHTAVLTGNQNQRWDHGIWVGEAPMTHECIILTENGVQKAKFLHRVTPKEKFLISESENAREFFSWNDVAENLKAAVETHQDQDPSGHRRMRLTVEIVMRIGATPGCSGCAGSRPHTEPCRVRSRRILADAKDSESSTAVGAGIESITKMTVEL